MTHLWMRAEQRPNEDRTGLTPEGTAALIARGIRLTVEDSRTRVLPTDAYRTAGADIAPEGSWPDAPDDAIVLGLKELPEDGTPLRHRHIMFGHAYKGQPAGRVLLQRFRAGGGTLLDLEYLTHEDGRRLAAFGYWAGFAGAAVSLLAWIAQRAGATCPPVAQWPDKAALLTDLSRRLATQTPPTALVIGALGRVGTGASDLCSALGLPLTRWDMAETAHGGPFPEIAEHDIFLNCILAAPGAPTFVPADTNDHATRLGVIGDIACDPTSDFSPVKVYDRTTTWAEPVLRTRTDPPLDVMAIDNLPSLLPRESSLDFAAQLLPVLETLHAWNTGGPAPTWSRAEILFQTHARALTT